MDPLTHYMLGYSLGRRWTLEKPQLKALTFAALLPDIDAISIIFGFEFFVKFHGTITHSIAGALVLSFVLALVFFLYYRKNVLLYAVIGISLHLIFDFIPTMWSRWGYVGMILLYPYSTQQITLKGAFPYSLLVGIVSVALLTLFSLYALLYYIKRNEYPWRIWIDERRILDILTGQGRKE